MYYENFISTPQNLKEYYNIPKRRDKNVPIKIGLYQALNLYLKNIYIYSIKITLEIMVIL